MYNQNYLAHYGVVGMHWGHRTGNQKHDEKMYKRAEQVLGRKIKSNDFGRPITNRSIRRVKQHDDFKKQYDAVKKKKDPSFEELQSTLKWRRVSHIISKIQKNPKTDLTKAYNIEKGKTIVSGAITSTLGGMGAIYLAVKYLG